MRKVAACAGWIAFWLLSSCARVEVPPGPGVGPAHGPGRLRGAVVMEGVAVPLEGATAEVAGWKSVVRADGTFDIKGLPVGKQSLVVEKTFPAGAVRRVIGVATLYVGENPMEITVRVRNATDLDAFCSDCHPLINRATRRDQKVRDIHVSGVVPRYSGNDPSLLDAGGKVTCESCHTVHRSSTYPFFGVENLKDGRFCNRCHGTKKN